MGDVTHLPRPTSLLHNAAGRRRMVDLALSFPTLRNAPLADKYGEFDARYFARWADRTLYSSGARHAARFVLMVFNSSTRWKIGRFDLSHAMQTWDGAHREAFVAWAKDPWWP